MSFKQKYLRAVYEGALYLGINEIGPVSPREIIVCIFMLLGSNMVNAIIFGDLISLV